MSTAPVLGGGRRRKSPQKAPSTASSANKPDKQRHKAQRKIRYQEIQARKREKEERDALHGKYRDRAKERREGVNPDYDDDGDFAKVKGEMRQYLGGDVEHTHLVSGLDRALLRSDQTLGSLVAPEAQHDAEPEDELEQVLAQSKALILAQEVQQENATPVFRSNLARHLVALVQGKAMASGPSEAANMFQPGRMRFECNLDPHPDDVLRDTPPVTKLSSTVATGTTYVAAGLPPIAMAKLVLAMSARRGGGRKKKKKDPRALEAARVEAARAAAALAAVKAAQDDDDIFGDADFDYVGSIGGTTITKAMDALQGPPTAAAAAPVPAITDRAKAAAAAAKKERCIRAEAAKKKQRRFGAVLQHSDDDPYGLDQRMYGSDDEADDQEQKGKDEATRRRKEDRRFNKELKQVTELVEKQRKKERGEKRGRDGTGGAPSAKRSKVLRGFLQ